MVAETIAAALHGRKVGVGWIARCPAHDDRRPSLSIKDGDDGRVLVRCHAGCDQTRVIETLAVLGLWPNRCSPWAERLRRPRPMPARDLASHDDTPRVHAALRLWREAELAASTLVETYLRSRGITLPVPLALRFHPRLKHPSDSWWPAMVALVTRGADGQASAIHRTFLFPDGTAKAPIEPQKMMLGPCGGGAVRLAPVASLLMVGEGIETCLAAMQATGLPAWAALSTSGVRVLGLPQEVREIIVLADGDEAGETAARDAARRWTREGRHVRIARPPQGLDFNDLLLGHTGGQPDSAA